MSDPDYMSHVLDVAKALQPQNLMAELQATWMHLESIARGRGWDVLAGNGTTREILREQIRLMIQLLYRLPDTSAQTDADQLAKKNAEYGGSWHRRGGSGAFFMLARKWDRVEQQVANHNGDLTAALRDEKTSEGLHDTLGDLRRYLLLVEAWHVAAEKPHIKLMTTAEVGEAVLHPDRSLNPHADPNCITCGGKGWRGPKAEDCICTVPF